MTKYSNNSNGSAIFGIVAIIVVLVIVGGFATNWKFGATASIANAGTTATGAGAQLGGTCPTQAQAFQPGAFYVNYDNTPATNQSAAVTWQLYAQGATTSQATGTTSSAGFNSVATTGSISGLNCNANYTYDAGDNVNYLEGTATINTGVRTTTQYNIKLFKYSAPSLYASNTSIVSTAISAAVRGVAASSVVNTATLQIKAGDASDSNGFGSLDVMTYNSYAISSIQVPFPSASSLGITVPIPAYNTGQNAFVAFIVPQQVHYSYVNFQPVITTTSAFVANVQNAEAQIGLYQYAITGYIYNAQFVPNVAVQPGTTGTAIIAGVTGGTYSVGNVLLLSNSLTS